jgi:hypothetical protein
MRRTKTYLTFLLLCISLILFGQNSSLRFYPVKDYRIKVKAHTQPKGSEILNFIWSEDFSNGLDGSGVNGAWSAAGDQAALWFRETPANTADGYRPDTSLNVAAYGDFIPNFYPSIGDSAFAPTISSPTAENGFIMLDADRFNSTSLPGIPGETTSNTIEAYLISPEIDLTGFENVQVQFEMMVRQCCESVSLSLDLSLDGGLSWEFSYDIFEPYADPNKTFDNQVVLELSEALSTASDLSQVRIRFSWAPGSTLYFLMLDDIALVETPEVDVHIGEVINQKRRACWYNDYFKKYRINEDGEFEFTNTQLDPEEAAVDYYNNLEYYSNIDYLPRALNWGVECANSGTTDQSVVAKIDVYRPNSELVATYLSESLTLPAGETDTIWFNDNTALQNLLYNSLEDTVIAVDYSLMLDGINDARPLNNIGNSESFIYSFYFPNNFFADEPIIIQGAYPENDSSGSIWSMNYSIEETTSFGQLLHRITHIQFAVQHQPTFAETHAGDPLFCNIRLGSVLLENPSNPETITTTAFSEDDPLSYSDPGLGYIITEQDLNHPPLDIDSVVWVSFQLPSTAGITEDIILSAEIFIPESSTITPILVELEEPNTAWRYTPNEGWVAQDFGLLINFKVEQYESVIDIENTGFSSIELYPNPFREKSDLYFQLTKTSEVEREI